MHFRPALLLTIVCLSSALVTCVGSAEVTEDGAGSGSAAQVVNRTTSDPSLLTTNSTDSGGPPGQNRNTTRCPRPGEFPCLVDGRLQCLPKSAVCNDTHECDGGTDERGCRVDCAPEEPGCDPSCTPGEQFPCARGTCVPITWRCDGEDDCGDSSDEHNCLEPPPCDPEQFRCSTGLCIPGKLVCNKKADCPGGEDEANCTHPPRCRDSQFSCGDGRCVPALWQCDGVPDCTDGSDEDGCPEHPDFRLHPCGDESLVPAGRVCDRLPDCGDGSDEADCEDVYPKDSHLLRGDLAGCGMTRLSCDLSRCLKSAWICDDFYHCSDHTDERYCYDSCEPHQLRCGNGQCLPKCARCDGFRDCADAADERDCPPQGTGSETNGTEITNAVSEETRKVTDLLQKAQDKLNSGETGEATQDIIRALELAVKLLQVQTLAGEQDQREEEL